MNQIIVNWHSTLNEDKTEIVPVYADICVRITNV